MVDSNGAWLVRSKFGEKEAMLREVQVDLKDTDQDEVYQIEREVTATQRE